MAEWNAVRAVGAAWLVVLSCGSCPSQEFTTQTRRDLPCVLRGRVVADEDGAPLAGARVTITGHQATGYPLAWSWLDWCDPEPMKTGADGTFELHLPAQPGRGYSDGYPSRVHVLAQADARVDTWGSVQLSQFFAAERQDLGDIRMPRGFAPRLRVVDNAGKPAPGVSVMVEPDPRPPRSDSFAPLRWQTCTAGADGLVASQFPMLPGTYRLTAIGQTLVDADTCKLTVDAGSGARETVLRIKPGPASARASGHVRQADGQPAANYPLRVICKIDGHTVRLLTSTAADGSFSLLAGGEPDNSKLVLLHDASRECEVGPALGTFAWGADDIVVDIASLTCLHLHVRGPNARVVEQLNVLVVPTTGQFAATRLNGTFAGGKVDLIGLAPDQYAVRVHARGAGTWPSAWTNVTVRGNGDGDALTIDLQAPVERTLQVTTTSGRPAANLQVQLVVGNPDRQDLARLSPHDPFALMYDHTMTTGDARQEFMLVQADLQCTDALGNVRLHCISSEDQITVLVRAQGSAPMRVPLSGWHAGTEPIPVTIDDGSRIEGSIVPVDFVAAADVSTAKERTDAQKNGPGRDPWQKSLGDLRDSHGAGIVLVRQGAQAIESPRVAIEADGSFTFGWMPPGRYTALLMLPRRDGDHVTFAAAPEAVATFEVVAGRNLRIPVAVPPNLAPDKR